MKKEKDSDIIYLDKIESVKSQKNSKKGFASGTGMTSGAKAILIAITLFSGLIVLGMCSCYLFMAVITLGTATTGY